MEPLFEVVLAMVETEHERGVKRVHRRAHPHVLTAQRPREVPEGVSQVLRVEDRALRRHQRAVCARDPRQGRRVLQGPAVRMPARLVDQVDHPRFGHRRPGTRGRACGRRCDGRAGDHGGKEKDRNDDAAAAQPHCYSLTSRVPSRAIKAAGSSAARLPSSSSTVRARGFASRRPQRFALCRNRSCLRRIGAAGGSLNSYFRPRRPA